MICFTEGNEDNGTVLSSLCSGVFCHKERKEPKPTLSDIILKQTGVDITLCPHCGKGHLRLTSRIIPKNEDHPDDTNPHTKHFCRKSCKTGHTTPVTKSSRIRKKLEISHIINCISKAVLPVLLIHVAFLRLTTDLRATHATSHDIKAHIKYP